MKKICTKKYNEEIVYIILLNYNSINHTIECLESIKMSSYKKYCVIIVDNLSTDDSVEKFNIYCSCNDMACEFIEDGYISEFKSEVVFVKSNTNNGFASGNNKAIKMIVDNITSGYVWILNNDTVIDRNALYELVKFTVNKKSLVGSVLVDYSNKYRVQTIGGFKFINILGIPRKIGKNLNVVDIQSRDIDVDMLSGASIFMNLNVLKELGVMPEGYFMYWEDADWSTKAKQNGIELEVATNSIVYHKEGGSIGFRSELQIMLDFKNTLKYYRKYNRKYIKFIIPFKLMVNILASVINRTNVISAISASIKGIKEYKMKLIK